MKLVFRKGLSYAFLLAGFFSFSYGVLENGRIPQELGPHFYEKMRLEDLQALRAVSRSDRDQVDAYLKDKAFVFNMESVQSGEGKAVAEFLGKRGHINDLKITHMNVEVLEAALRILREKRFRFHNLVTLDISENNVPGPWDVQEPQLPTRLISEELLGLLLGLSPHVTSLDVSVCAIDSKDLNMIAKRLPGLTSLVIRANKLGDSGAKIIAKKFPKLKHLNIAHNNLTEVGAAHLSALIHLTYLDVNQNFIGNMGAVHLSNLENLEYLNLYMTDLGDVGVKAIAKLDKLASLTAAANRNITDIGLNAIARGCLALKYLDIRNHMPTKSLLDRRIETFHY